MTWVPAPLERVLELADPGVWGPENTENGVSVLRSTNFRDDGSLDLAKLAFRTIPDRKKSKKILQVGDILLERSGGGPRQPVGRVCYFEGDSEPHVFGNFCQRLRPNASLIEPRFLFWYLHYVHITGGTLAYQKQTTGIRNLDYKEFLRHAVPVPPPSEQRRIVEILGQADHLRHLRTEADAKAGRILPALFLEMFGDPATNPLGWPVRRFESICESRLGKMLDAKQQTGANRRPYLRNANVYWDRLALKELLEMDFDELDREEFCLQPGDVLICEGGEVGRSAIWNDEIPDCYFQKALHRARPFPDVAVSEFVVYLLWELAKRGVLQGSVSQVTFSHLTGVKLKALRVPVPPLGLQKLFADRVQLFKQLVKLTDAATRIDSLFSTLIHRAFSGSLTAFWREAHMKEMHREVEQHASALAGA